MRDYWKEVQKTHGYTDDEMRDFFGIDMTLEEVHYEKQTYIEIN
jgi:hypothetical protein